jgi:beta-N-acetylhexosaminidase
VNVELISDTIDDPTSDERAQAVADHAVTLLRNQDNQVPLRTPDQSCAVILTESRYTQQGRQFVMEIRRRARGMKIKILDPTSSQAELLDTASVAAGCQNVIVAAFVTVSAYRGDVALPGEFTSLVNTIIASGKPVTLIAFGNPYLLRNFPNTGAYLATFSTTTTSEIAAAKALFGEIAITGHLPVSIPGYAKPGDGIQQPVRMTAQ